jgi:hypothetical protein
MTTETTGSKTMAFYASDEDQEHIAAIVAMLRRRGHRINTRGVTDAVSYALSRVFLLECSTDGAQAHERNAA